MSNTLKYTLIGIGILVLIAGAYIGYKSFKSSKEEKAEAERATEEKQIEIEKE